MKNDCSYSNKGNYGGYNKDNKEREKNDYYATPPCEVLNILQQLSLDLNGCNILDNSMGQGHLLIGLQKYLQRTNQKANIFGTDLIEREEIKGLQGKFAFGKDFDVLSQEYIKNIKKLVSEPIDYVIINPPFKYMTQFVETSLEIATKGVLVFGRIQYLESIQRYNNIHKIIPPSDIYGYIERVACCKNGIPPKDAGVQMHAWFYYDMQDDKATNYHFLHKYKRKGE